MYNYNIIYDRWRTLCISSLYFNTPAPKFQITPYSQPKFGMCLWKFTIYESYVVYLQ